MDKSADTHSADPANGAELFWDEHPTPVELAAGLDLDPAQWPVIRADVPRRRAIGPGGETATVTDHVLVLSRAAG